MDEKTGGYDVACVGILTADVIVKTVDAMPPRGKLNLVDGVSLHSGGCAANTAVDLAKLGADVAVVGMVGRDGFGTFLQQEMKAHGVNTDGLLCSDEAGSSASVVMIGQGGERSFWHNPGANGVLTERDIRYEVLEKSRIVFVTGTMLMPRFDGADCAAMLKKCRAMGKITALDTAWDDTGRWMSLLSPCLSELDYFLPSEEEAVALSGETNPERMAAVFFERGVRHVVIKLGKRGCYAQESPDRPGRYLKSYDSISAVDTTGAGDSFCAGFLYGLLRQMPFERCCEVANAVGTHCVMAVGASTGIPSYETIQTFMEEQAK